MNSAGEGHYSAHLFSVANLFSGLQEQELTVYGVRSQIKQIASVSDTSEFVPHAQKQNKWYGMGKANLFTLEMTGPCGWHLYQSYTTCVLRVLLF